LRVLLQPVSGCEGYPVVEYALLLKESESNESYVFLDSTAEPRFTINSSFIRKGSAYHFRVRAVNILSTYSETEEQVFCELSYMMS
jgi:hypothetical protein